LRMGFIASKSPERSLAPSLIDPRFDQDSCGVGFVATLRNQPSHQILTQALTALARLAHRGAVAADGKSSDGVGVMTAIPRAFFLAQAEGRLAAQHTFGVGVFFFPRDCAVASEEARFAGSLAAQGLRVAHWRQVPIREDLLGEEAR